MLIRQKLSVFNLHGMQGIIRKELLKKKKQENMDLAEEVKDEVSHYRKALCKDSYSLILYMFEELSSCNILYVAIYV